MKTLTEYLASCGRVDRLVFDNIDEAREALNHLNGIAKDEDSRRIGVIHNELIADSMTIKTSLIRQIRKEEPACCP